MDPLDGVNDLTKLMMTIDTVDCSGDADDEKIPSISLTLSPRHRVTKRRYKKRPDKRTPTSQAQNVSPFPTIRHGNIGIFVVNSTALYLTIRLSIAATLYFENMIAPGEIFYRWPHAVWMTVSVHPTILMGKMTRRQREREIAIAVSGGVVGAGTAAGVASLPFVFGPSAIVDVANAFVSGKSATDVIDGVQRRGQRCFERISSDSVDDKNVVNNVMDSFGYLEHRLRTRLEEVAELSMGWKLSESDAEAIRTKYGELGHVMVFELDAVQALRKSILSVSMRGVYAGNTIHRDGACLEVIGLPTVHKRNGQVEIVEENISIVEHDDFQTFIDNYLSEEKFTRISYRSYFKREKPM